jgi:UDP-N-acetylmuramyl pentapeptide phosphotransferase/UDP-N-acetylglucosamine-1-phosphate transferase
MVAVLIAFTLGAVGTATLELTTQRLFRAEVFRRANYRGADLATAMGMLLLPVTVAYAALADLAPPASELFAPRWVVGSTTLLIVGACALGFIDDIGGVGQSGGFSGHIRSLMRGEVSTGALKMLGIPVLSIVAVRTQFMSESTVEILRDAALISVCANLANLFDRAPGRVVKVSALALIIPILVWHHSALAFPALVLGGAVALLRGDLAERFMVGDAGSNTLGAVVGMAVVTAGTPLQRWIVLAVVLLANLASEFVSFSKVIDNTAPLRWLDRAGSLRER